MIINIFKYSELSESAQQNAVKNCKSEIANELNETDAEDFRYLSECLTDIFPFRTKDTYTNFTLNENEKNLEGLALIDDIIKRLNDYAEYYETLADLTEKKWVFTGCYADEEVCNFITDFLLGKRSNITTYEEFANGIGQALRKQWKENEDLNTSDELVKEYLQNDKDKYFFENGEECKWTPTPQAN